MGRPKQIGTEAETAVARYFRDHGFAQAERRALAGTHDLGDIVGLGPVVVECKAGNAAATASDKRVLDWLAETEQERKNARADIGLLVMKRAGVGAANAGRWWAVMTLADVLYLSCSAGHQWRGLTTAPVRMNLSDAVTLLRAAGYGDPLPEEGAA